MILWDVNLWVYSFRQDSPYHEDSRKILQEGLLGRIQFLFSPQIAASFLRLVTNPKIFREPSPPDEAWAFIEALENLPNASFTEIDEMTFGIFKHLSLIHSAKGNEVPDILLAAMSIRHDAVLATADRGFSRFKELKLQFL
ncbi:MAG: PIN domain-containing protein [Spirochaetales bacterium]|nr:PIN domain-containing protein [Spirochaetales bacterium]